MTHRGSHTAQIGDPIYLIESIYHDGHSAVKVFTSLSGFKSGLAAVKAEIRRMTGFSGDWGIKEFKTYLMEAPTWIQFPRI